MKRTYLICMSIFCASMVSAAEPVFVDSAGAMVDQMLEGDQKHGLTRGFVVKDTRSIRVRAKNRNGIEENTMVKVAQSDMDRAARLRVEFDVNSASLRPSAYPLLAELGTALQDARVVGNMVCIKGHTDSDGDDSYNLELSYARANMVKRYLQGVAGIPSDTLQIVGFGEGMPLVENTSAANKQKNRRVEVALNCTESSLYQ